MIDSPRLRVVSTFNKNLEAKQAYTESIATLPPNASALLFGDSVIVSLPANDTASGKKWLAQLKAQSTNTFLVTNNITSLTLAFEAPDSVTSSNLAEILQESLVGGATNLVPPWDPQFESPAFAPHLAARHALSKITKEWARTYSAPEVKAATKALMKDKSTNFFQEVMKTQEKVLHDVQERGRKNLESEYAGTAYLPLVEYHAELSKESMTNFQKRAEIESKLAELEGCFPADSTRSIGPAAAWHNGKRVQMPFLTLSEPETDLPQLMHWLTEKGCTKVKYDIQTYDASSADSDDEN